MFTLDSNHVHKGGWGGVSTAHISINSEQLVPCSGVFHLRGTTNEHLPTTIVDVSSTADCVAIQYERSGHS